MALKLRGKFSIVVAAVAILTLAACDTQPATDVGPTEATLNAKGACTQGASGTWEYQILRDGAWDRVGPQHGFSCAQNTGEVAFTPERARYLVPGTRYVYRLVSRLSDGTVQTWDANGTDGGTAFDSFTTQPSYDVAIYTDGPATEDDDPTASAAGCRAWESSNVRRKEMGVLRDVAFVVALRIRWRYCKSTGVVTKMYPALEHSCSVKDFGAANGYKCLNPEGEKVRAYSLGGNPEHVVWTLQVGHRGARPAQGDPVLERYVVRVQLRQRQRCHVQQRALPTGVVGHVGVSST